MKLKWDQVGERLFETGTRKGVLYPQQEGTYPKGVAWNGLTGFDENPSGGEPSPQYADDMKYLNLRGTEEFEGTIKAFTYPDEFEACDGSAEITPGVHVGQQTRRPFGFSYQSRIGNDTEGEDYGYKLHLIYGATVSPSSKSYETINDSPDAIEFSWDLTTVPVDLSAYDAKLKPAAKITIDSTTAPTAALAALEDILYGTAEEVARLPLPAEVFTILKGEEVGEGE